MFNFFFLSVCDLYSFAKKNLSNKRKKKCFKEKKSWPCIIYKYVLIYIYLFFPSSDLFKCLCVKPLFAKLFIAFYRVLILCYESVKNSKRKRDFFGNIYFASQSMSCHSIGYKLRDRFCIFFFSMTRLETNSKHVFGNSTILKNHFVAASCFILQHKE